MIIDHHYHYPIIPDDANQSFFKSSSSSFLILVIIAASPADDSIFIILKEILVWYFCILCVSICDNPLKIHRIIAHQPPCCISDALYHWCIRFSGLPMAFCQPPITRVSLVIFFQYFCIKCVSLLYHWRVIGESLVYNSGIIGVSLVYHCCTGFSGLPPVCRPAISHKLIHPSPFMWSKMIKTDVEMWEKHSKTFL